MMNPIRGKTHFADQVYRAGAGGVTLGGNNCVIELEGARGKLRFRLQGSRARDIASLSRALMGGYLLIQITPRMIILVAIETINGKKGSIL